MKNLLTTIFAFSTLFIFAQTPQGINYQSIIRSTGGIVLPNAAVNIEFKLYNGLAGALVYNESHGTTTNSFGMVNLIIGQGSPISGTFNTITWSNGIAYEVYVNSTLIGTKQLFMSVPYALNAGSAPAPTVTFTNNILSVGGNTTAISPGITYTAGTGIDITGGVITNTLAAVPPTITGAGSATVTSSGNTFTVNTPVSQIYTPGTGIDITGGVITNIAPPATPYTLTTNSNTITINNGIAVSSATVPSYSAGNGINISGGVITNTASSTNLPAAFNGQFIYFNGSIWDTIPRDNIYFDGTNFGVGTQSPAANFHVAGYGRFDASISTPQIYTDNIKITGGINTQVLTSDAIGNGTWQALPNYSLTQSGSNINLTQNGTSVATVTLTAATSTSLTAGNSNILLNQSGNAYTITPVTPTFANAGPTTITGTYPNYTINSAPTASTTLVQGNNISLNQSVNTYTVSAPGYSISLPGGNTVQITNGTSTSTAAIASTSLTLTGANNTILSAGGNTVSLNTYSAGTGISVSGTAPNYVITNTATAITQSLTGTGISSVTPAANSFTVNTPMPTYTPTTGVLSFGGTNTVVATPSLSIIGNVLRSGPSTNTLTLPPSVITGTGTGIATVTASINNFTVNVPSPTYLPGTGVLNFGGTNTVVVTPTLVLTGTTLSSGPITNSVNLSSLSVWSNSVGILYPTTLTNSIAVGTSGPLTDKMEINYASAPGSTHLHFKQTGADAFSRIKFSNAIAPTKYWLNSVTSAATDINSGYNFFYNNGTIGRNLFTVAGDGKVSVNPFSLSYATLLEVNGGFELDSTIAVNGLNAMPPVSLINSGKIYFDRTQSKFMVSENAGVFKPLFGPSPWVQGTGNVSLNNINDKVGIGTNTPGYKLDIAETFSINGGAAVNILTSSSSLSGANSGIYSDLLGSSSGNYISGYFRSEALAGATGSPTGVKGLAVGNSLTSAVGVNGVAMNGNQNNGVFGYASGGATNYGVWGEVAGPGYAGYFTGGPTLVDGKFVLWPQSTAPAAFMGQGSFYYDNTSNQIMVAENSTIYKPLFTAQPWIQGTGTVTLATNSDKVGIGTATPGSKLTVIESSTVSALSVNNSGSGAAIYATAGTATNSALSLWVDNGHVKATGPSVTTSALNVSGGFTVPGIAPILTNCNDVKGTFSFTTSATGLSNGAFIELEIRFAKSYSIAPVVIATSLLDMQGLDYIVSNVSPTSFFVRVYKSLNPSVGSPTAISGSATFKFNYMVIE